MDRRRFLQAAAAVTAGFSGLHSLLHAAENMPLKTAGGAAGYGPLQADPAKILDLPAGFRYVVISRTGEKMNDGLLVPGKHDGMAAFPAPEGRTVLVRNHEITSDDRGNSPFGKDYSLFATLEAGLLYDSGYKQTPALGGTTRLLFNTREQQLEGHELSLAGTVRNCAGGPTPWNSWLSCEETVQKKDKVHEQDHGWVFEVPAYFGRGLAAPRPIRELGRFYHEAVAIEPRAGVIYQTEDRADGLLYRSSLAPGQGMRGLGPLQALKIKDQPGCETRNWEVEKRIAPGMKLEVEWLELDAIDAPEDDLRYRGFAAGAARFARGEGAWFGNDAVYFAMTSGGAKKIGQVWRYFPSPFEGTPREQDQPGVIELFIEPNNQDLIERPDNLTVAPWGDLFICEDGQDDQFVVGVTPRGELFQFARNALNGSEFCGGCFSPDGTTFFVNIQNPGLTLAVSGPWRE